MKVLIDFDNKTLKVEGSIGLNTIENILTAIKNSNLGYLDTWSLDQIEVLEEIGKQKQERHVLDDDEKYAILPNYDIGLAKYSLVRLDGVVMSEEMCNSYSEAVNTYELNNPGYVLEDLTNNEADDLQQKVYETNQSKL